MYQKFTVPNYSENNRHVDSIGVNVRHNIKPVNVIPSPAQALSYDERPITKVERPVLIPAALTSSDERPIRPNPNPEIYEMPKNEPKLTKIELKEKKPVLPKITFAKEPK